MHCFLCDEVFHEFLSFKLHFLSHRNDPDFECPDCTSCTTYEFATFLSHINSLHLAGLEYNKEQLSLQDESLKCDLCSRSFKHQSSLDFHRTTHKPTEAPEVDFRPFQCDLCGSKFSFKKTLTHHIRGHVKETPSRISTEELPCPRCQVLFPTQLKLDQHSRSVHGLKPTCEQCGKAFQKLGDLKRHLLIHLGIKKYHCSECGKTFTHQTSLRHHNATHSLTKALICSYCGLGFSYVGNLKVHIRSRHTNERPYACHVCEKTFARTANLNEHLKIHSGEKNVQCRVCDKFFRSTSALSKHKKAHLGIRAHHCSACDKSFLEHGHLVNHMRTHSNEKPFQCKTCNKAFRRPDTLRTHEKTHNRVEYLDLDTNLAFNSASLVVEDGEPESQDGGIQTLQDISIVPASMLDPTTIVTNYDQFQWTSNTI